MAETAKARRSVWLWLHIYLKGCCGWMASEQEMHSYWRPAAWEEGPALCMGGSSQTWFIPSWPAGKYGWRCTARVANVTRAFVNMAEAPIPTITHVSQRRNLIKLRSVGGVAFRVRGQHRLSGRPPECNPQPPSCYLLFLDLSRWHQLCHGSTTRCQTHGAQP